MEKEDLTLESAISQAKQELVRIRKLQDKLTKLHQEKEAAKQKAVRTGAPWWLWTLLGVAAVAGAIYLFGWVL